MKNKFTITNINIPNYGSISNWVCRAGIGLLSNIKRWNDQRWVAIIDTSISYCKQKVLVVLRVSLEHFAVKKEAITFSDIECIGLVIKETWNGETVKESLQEIFEKAGTPAAILKDGGEDLKKGVELWKEEHKKTLVIRDIGHVVANELKRAYSKLDIFLKLLKVIDGIMHKLSCTVLAYLKPPKIRTKGRFQGISRVAKWAINVLEIIENKTEKQTDDVKKINDIFSKLKGFRYFLKGFCTDCLIVNEFMEILKNKGLNQASYHAAKKILLQIPSNSKVRNNILSWLDEHINKQCRLKMQQTPLIVSSDIIESFMGKIKAIIDRNSIKEFGKTVLAAPLFCGNLREEDILLALNSCSHKQLKDWEIKNNGNSTRKQKNKFFKSDDAIVQSSNFEVPKTPITKVA